MLNLFFRYTAGVLTQFAAAGIPVEMISLGNEITNGLLWPVGETSSAEGFAGASQLLHSAASAVRATSPSTLIVTHLDNGWNPYALTWYQAWINYYFLISRGGLSWYTHSLSSSAEHVSHGWICFIRRGHHGANLLWVQLHYSIIKF
jgi:arabinogalactan endo-1,4-beta-galactosidase